METRRKKEKEKYQKPTWRRTVENELKERGLPGAQWKEKQTTDLEKSGENLF